MVSHRDPPKPQHYFDPRPGQCRWCGSDVLRSDGTVNRRANWHKECLGEYKVIAWPKVTRRAVWIRDRGVCTVCGTQCAKKISDSWHLDHIQPLIEAQGNLDYWKLPNLQTLCPKHHIEKTSIENSLRAAKKRELKEKK